MDMSSSTCLISRSIDHGDLDDDRRENHVESLINDENRDPTQSPDRMDVDKHCGSGMLACISPQTKLETVHESAERVHNDGEDGHNDNDDYDDFVAAVVLVSLRMPLILHHQNHFGQAFGPISCFLY